MTPKPPDPTTSRASTVGHGLWIAGRLLFMAFRTAALFYLIVANLLIATPLLAKIVNGDPDAFTLAYEGGWTVWPGRVHLRKLALHGSSRILEWSVASERAGFDLSLRELFHKRVFATRVRGDNLVFRLRMRLTPAEAREPRAQALPHIEGFDDPPVLRAGPPEPTDDSALWTVRLDDTDVGVREIWIQHYRYVGNGRTRGGFLMHPQHVIEVPPSLFEVRSGAVTIADRTLVFDTRGALACHLLPIDPKEVHGVDAFGSVLARAELDAEAPELGILAFYIPAASGVRLEGGGGPIHVNAGIDHGRLVPGSAITYDSRELAFHSRQVDGTAEATVWLHAAPDGAAFLTTRVRRATVARHGVEMAPVRVHDAEIEAEAPVLDILDLPPKVSTRLDMPFAVIPDLRPLFGPAHGDAPQITRGGAVVDAHVEVDPEGRGSGRVDVRGKRVGVRWRDASVEGDIDSKIEVDVADPKAHEVAFGKSHVELRDVTLRRKDHEQDGWWASVDVRKTDVGKGHVEAVLQARCKNTQPAIDFLEAGDALPEWAGGLLHREIVTVNARLAHREGRFDFNLYRAKTSGLDVRGRLTKPDRARPEGAFLIKSGPLSVGIAIDAGGTGIAPFAGDAWVDQRIADLGK